MGEAATLPEAVPDEAAREPKRAWRIRVPRLRRERSSADPAEATSESEPAAAEDPLPLAYQTFSSKLAPTLTALGGLIAIAGGLGVWVRAVRLETEGLPPEEVATQLGYNSPEGLSIAVFGAIAALTSWLWLRRRPVFKIVPSLVTKLLPLLSSAGVIALVAWQLPLIDGEAQALAQEAIADANFVTFHAGLGWGAWCMAAAAVLLFLGSIVGILREIDLRKGKAA